MTDNAEFMARYLQSDDNDHSEHIGQSSIDDEALSGETYPVAEPKAAQPASLPARESAPVAAGSKHELKESKPPDSRDSFSAGRAAALSAAFEPQQHVGAAPSAKQPYSAPEPPIDQGSGQHGRPPRSRADEGSTRSPHEWMPEVDPAERWAPQPGLEGYAPLAGQHLQLREVVKQRRQPPEAGWRKVVYLSTGHLLNLGAGPAERRLIDYKARIVANIPGNYQIAAVSVKGGVGKSRITAGVGSIFAELRKQPVIAIDANPTYGGLGRLIDPTVQASMRDFLAAKDLVDYPRARFYTGQNKQGLEVLAGNQNVADPMHLDAVNFTDTVGRARRFYQLVLVDCGAEIEHSVIPAVLSTSDALMIVGSCNVEGALAVETTIDWLAARNGHSLLERSVVVLSDSYQSASTRFIEHVHRTLGTRVHSVKTIPWDPHLQDAVTLDFTLLRRRTQLAFVELAAELAGGFPTAGTIAV